MLYIWAIYFGIWPKRLGVVLDTTSEGLDRLFVPIATVFVPIETKYT
jgi:hypothetical protein